MKYKEIQKLTNRCLSELTFAMYYIHRTRLIAWNSLRHRTKFAKGNLTASRIGKICDVEYPASDLICPYCLPKRCF